MNIIHEDKDKLILYKPAGQLVQSGKGFDTDLVSEVMNYRKRKGEPAYAAVINRLDRPVSGVVLMAKNKEAAARYSKIMQEQGFCKQYYALVYGKMEAGSDVLTDYIKKTKDNIAVVCDKSDRRDKFNESDKSDRRDKFNESDKSDRRDKFDKSGKLEKSDKSYDCDKDAKFAKLEYEVVESEHGNDAECVISCLKITLHTGRFHQIRAQLSSRGHAIVGDVKYAQIYGDVKYAQLYGDVRQELPGDNRRADSGTERHSLQHVSSQQIQPQLPETGIHLKPHEIALCAHSLNVDGTEYTVTPEWWKV